MEQKLDDTKEKILAAAATLFFKNGYAATRTRDIASMCGVNLALINYHFKSKEALYHIIMLNGIDELFGSILPIINDTELDFDSRISKLVNTYINKLINEPDLPIFVFSELQKKGPNILLNKMTIITHSAFSEQLKKLSPNIDPIQYVITLIGMIIVPFIIRSVLTANGTDQKAFNELIEQRRQLIPVWAKAIVNSNESLS